MAKDLRVIIVGAGFGGLCAAIECKIRGMNPIVIETYPTSSKYGDIIDFFPNGGRIIEAWDDGNVGRELMRTGINKGDKFQYFKYDGTLIYEEPWVLKPHHYWKQYAGHRGNMHNIVKCYAESIGVELLFGETVAQYVDGERPGVITESGKKIFGDVVVAADGPRSKARQQLLGLPDLKVNSGYAIFRAYFKITDEHRKNPWLAEFCDPNIDHTKMWTAKDYHMIIYTWNKGQDIGWVITHKDTEDIGESWSFPGKIEDAIACIKAGNFERKLLEVVKATPPEVLVDYKLVWRDPILRWLSPSARSVVIGDAAHCHLPTSAQGGSQALEDGLVLAMCLDKAKGDVPLALKVFERIRFHRSHVTHMSSVSMRDTYHNVDWDGDDLKEHPEQMNLPRFSWVIEHDAVANVEKHFDRVANDVRTNRPGTLEELAVPAEGDYSLEMRVDSTGHVIPRDVKL
ncbi:hypothetical protein LTR10_020452 [Elasticomyces elasticus]|uniref:FAD-binding domain-containing protein n=1 Tax=Exophiala sideris TaxID=1016849 RepID=A0ABR0J3M8_9EURO|nr:hypothetical protein LTR10_020452 [Elasticomyces elasticus]KAK5027024.1 hypothetical protein LTS07_007323 [Exophiala sideris]KAK5034028.1 hypothetical protein LTR13_006628 [Exophiala sideris]KAK5055697.1 hypothetical protein LTR69_008072 [Exophiala sideris]KAK5180970.1 hypothetical protein LTR44_006790 [Eurotiomycetes sp. CCFEE 6388]